MRLPNINQWILAVLSLPIFIAAAHGAQLCSEQPFAENFGYSSEDSGGGSYLGVDTRDVSADRLGVLKLKEEHGVEITLVDQDAPAGKAGLKEHDVILTINGNQVESVEQLRRMIREVPPGRAVNLGISRDGQTLAVKAMLADRKKTFAMGEPGKNFSVVMPAIPAIPAIPAMPAIPATPFMPEMDMPVSVVIVHSSARSGLMVENLTPQLGDFFGAKNGKGVLVRSVEKGSRAEQAGFRAGDVIVKINGESISDSGDFTHAIHGRKNNAVGVSIIREKKEQNLTLTLPEHNQSQLRDMDISEETSDADSDVVIDLSEAQSEIAHLRPAIEQGIRDMRVMQPAMQQAVRQLRQQREELQRQMRQLDRQLKLELKREGQEAQRRELQDRDLQDHNFDMQENQRVEPWKPQADI